MKKTKKPIQKIGILGGGQLGRMSALAAYNLGFEIVIYSDIAQSPACLVTPHSIIGEYSDFKRLKKFADTVDVISYEFENIPLETLEFLEKIKPVRPNADLLMVSQHRVHEKAVLNDLKIPTAKWAMAISPSDILRTMDEWKTEKCILKTCRFGYDGKGQARVNSKREVLKAWKKLNSPEIIVEEIIDFDFEFSLIAARDVFEDIVFYDAGINTHKNHILDTTKIPANLPRATLNKAKNYMKTLCEALDIIGVVTLEFFVTKQGKILANEIAPRTHNSGHWSIDACAVSQFENHIRAAAGLPVLEPHRHSDCVMINLIGNDIKKVPHYLKTQNACVHLYGKKEARAGRKMGHVTILKK